MAVVDELVTILGVKLASDAMTKLKSFSEGVSKITSTVAGLGLVVTGSAVAAGAFIKSVVDEASALDTLSQKTGISTTALQEWQYAAQKSGVDAKAVQNDLVSLQKTMSSPIPGQFNMTMAMFGVSARGSNGELKTTDQLLEDMADKLKGMSNQRAAQWASKLGISDDTLMLLKQGKAGIEELRAEAHKLGGIIPEDSIKRASQFKAQLAELQFAIRGITSQVAIATLPALSRMVEIFKVFIADNREFISIGLSALMDGIVNGFERFFTVLKQIAGKFSPITDAIKNFLPEMEGAELVTHLVTGALTGLLIIFAPLIAKFAAFGAAILALSIIFEDFFTFLEGGDSVIGTLFDAFKERWPDLFNALSKLWDWLKNNIEPALDAVWEAVKYVGAAFGEVGATILDVFNDIAGPLSDFFGSFTEKYPALYNKLTQLAGFIGGTLKRNFDLIIVGAKNFIKVIGEIVGVLGKVYELGAKVLNEIFSENEEGAKATAVHGNRGMGLSDNTFRTRTTPGLPAQQAGGMAPPRSSQYNDNKTINMQIATSDPAQAANMAVDAINSNSSVNTNTPGSYAPVAS